MRRRVWVFVLNSTAAVVAWTGCSEAVAPQVGGPDADGGATIGQSSGDSGAFGTSTEADQTTSTTMPDTSADDPSQGSDNGTSGSGTSGDTSSDGATTGPREDVKLCSLQVIDPKTDPASVIDAGDGPDQIPAVIGEALLRNCGCHYTDDAEGYTDYVSDAVPLNSLADFHADFEGVFPAGFEGEPTYRACEVRVVFGLPLPMPPDECDVDAGQENMTMGDFVLFAQWFDAGAPGGGSFP